MHTVNPYSGNIITLLIVVDDTLLMNNSAECTHIVCKHGICCCNYTKMSRVTWKFQGILQLPRSVKE